MEQFGQYELLRLIHDGKIRTFSARESESGRMLLIHKLAPDSRVFETVQRLAPIELGLLVGAGETAGCRYLATYDLPALHDFEQFVHDRLGVELAPSSEPAQPTPPASNELDEFDRLFGQAAQPEATAPAEHNTEPGEFTRMFQAASPRKSALEDPAKPRSVSGRDIGDVTQFFRVPSGRNAVEQVAKVADKGSEPSSPVTQPEAARPKHLVSENVEVPIQSYEVTRTFPAIRTPSLPVAPPPPSDAGEFTKLFRAPSTPEPAAAAQPQPPPPSDTGEFTKLFRSPSTPEPRPAAAAQPQPPPPSDTGEFTKLFRPPSTPEPPVTAKQPLPPPSDAGEFTKLFRPPSAPEAPVTAKQAPPPPTDAGEFTKLFRPPSTPAPPAAAQPQPPPPSDAGEFTKLFRPPSTPEPAAAAQPQPPPPTDAGEFTRFFRPSGTAVPNSGPAPRKPMSGGFEPGAFTRFVNSEPEPNSATPPEFPEPVSNPERDPSEFTRMFGRPSDRQAQEPRSSSGPAQVSAGATGIFERPAARPPAQAPTASPSQGEYTRLFEAPARSSVPETPSAQVPAVTSPAPKTAGSYVPLIIILSILALAAVILILYFVLKK